MNNYEKYVEAYVTALSVEKEVITPELQYQGIAEWDSVGHMELVSELEDVFDISLETDDIIDFNSFKAGIEILKKYDIVIEE